MAPHSLNGPDLARDSQILWEDDERVFRRGWRLDDSGKQCPALFLVPATEYPTPSRLDQFRHEFELRDELDRTWAVRPLELVRESGRTLLVLDDPGGEPLERLLDMPMEVGAFLRLAVGIAAALGKLHQRGLVHKDIKPGNILVNDATGEVHLTGFGIASRLRRERQSPHLPETIVGTLAYMAPEQTGRMNRSIDSRSDLYALGVTFYQMLTGVLPFAAADPMEWVHCHLARRPALPAARCREIPGAISAIVMKLLEKRAEDRYQTAAGLERDLCRCRAEWEAQRRIDEFPLGERDATDRLLIPEKLYGRQSEVETLLDAFDQVVKGGAPELVLVSGYSGVGKSSVVNELQPVLVPPRGLFAAGKFDQYKRDIPYSTLAQAFRTLIRQLLTKSEAELDRWRRELRHASEGHGQLIVDLVPELKLIIGDQPPLPEVSAKDAQRRFQLLFQRFVGVFARPEHPLALFLDDLQWLDTATLDLLEHLLTRSELRHLLLIGAYRDNEVNAAHPLMRKLEAIKGAGGRVTELKLTPLAQEHLEQLLADALRCERERSMQLTQLVYEKTAGNPFFANQFIASLAEEGMLAFDHDASRWSWDLARIHAKGYTDNVIDLMVTKLNRLPLETQRALQQLACLGNVAEATTLSLVLEASPEQVHAVLWESMRHGLIDRLPSSYKFIHDRVQEAAYSMIPEAWRTEVHLRIGRLLATHHSPQEQEETIFDIANHLNRGAPLITSREEREKLAELNLRAAKRAKASTAYASALKYLLAGAELLGATAWERRRDLTYMLEFERAECEFLTGELPSAAERLSALSNRVANTLERATLAYLQISVCSELTQFDRAVVVALDYLRHVGIDLPPHPTDDEVRCEYEQIWSQLGDRSIGQITDLPLMSDPEPLQTVRILTNMMVPASFTDRNLNHLMICKAATLSLEHGNCDASCHGYLMLARVAIERFGDFDTGAQFAQVGLELVEGAGLKRFEGGTYLSYALWIAPWTKHVRVCSDLMRRAFDAANRVGDPTYAGYASCCLQADRLVAGDSLSEVQSEAEVCLAAAQKANLSYHVDLVTPQLALIRTLRGLTRKFGYFDSEQIEEASYERHLADNAHLRVHECWYRIRKLQARYFAGDYRGALEASAASQGLMSLHIEDAEYHFYSALSRAASWESGTADERKQLDVLLQHVRQLEIWAKHCPANWENRAALVGAEIARIEGREPDAMRLYEKAIHSSRINGLVNNEAIAYERAAAFYRARGFDEIADTYLRSARTRYAAWGAEGKVRQLDRLYPRLKQGQPPPGPASTIAAPLEGLDLATIIRVSQEISGEMVLEKLVDTVMRKAMEHAGAERGLLIIQRGEELHIQAESRTAGNDVIVSLRDASLAATAMPKSLVPESILRFVIRTHESVILDDASSANRFSADPHFLQNRARSILCLPLLNRAKLSGLLYLENNLAPGVFTSGRITVLRMLVSQAAISLENTRLYRDLEDRESKIRRLVDANIVGIFVADLEGRIVEGNDAFLRIVGYDRDDLACGRLSWTKLTPPDWGERNMRALAELNSSGTAQVFEKEYFRKDGSRVPVLVGAALFKEGGNEGVAFVLDLTERKRSESALQLAKAELANATRVITLNALTASIAHEVNQPLAGIVTNASTCLRMLNAIPPNIEGARETARRTLRDGSRASDVITRLRALFSNKEFTLEPLDLNEATLEVIALSLSDLQRNGVTARSDLAGRLPLVVGDRVQLQQVILNMIRNGSDAMTGIADRTRELLIKTERAPNDRVCLSVMDVGVGIQPETAARLFEPFYTTKRDGMGIGLSISRSIIEAHHGRIWARANEGPGATFSFCIPCEHAPS